MIVHRRPDQTRVEKILWFPILSLRLWIPTKFTLSYFLTVTIPAPISSTALVPLMVPRGRSRFNSKRVSIHSTHHCPHANVKTNQSNLHPLILPSHTHTQSHTHSLFLSSINSQCLCPHFSHTLVKSQSSFTCASQHFHYNLFVLQLSLIMARFCTMLFVLAAMLVVSAVSQSPAPSHHDAAAPTKSVNPPSHSPSKSPPAVAPSPAVSSPPSPTPVSPSSPSPSPSPSSSISSPPSNAPAPSASAAVSNGFAVAGSVFVGLVAAVLIV